MSSKKKMGVWSASDILKILANYNDAIECYNFSLLLASLNEDSVCQNHCNMLLATLQTSRDMLIECYERRVDYDNIKAEIFFLNAGSHVFENFRRYKAEGYSLF